MLNCERDIQSQKRTNNVMAKYEKRLKTNNSQQNTT